MAFLVCAIHGSLLVAFFCYWHRVTAPLWPIGGQLSQNLVMNWLPPIRKIGPEYPGIFSNIGQNWLESKPKFGL